jgi:hypothetical protein
VLQRADLVRTAAATQQARSAAPAAVLRGDKLREEAHEAFEQGDVAGAQILGESQMRA